MLLALTLVGLFHQPAEAHVDPSAFLKLCEKVTPQEIEAHILSGADVNAREIDGWTALMFAADNKKINPEVIVTLIKAGADVNYKNTKGRRAIDYARDNKRLKDTDALKELADRSK